MSRAVIHGGKRYSIFLADCGKIQKEFKNSFYVNLNDNLVMFTDKKGICRITSDIVRRDNTLLSVSVRRPECQTSTFKSVLSFLRCWVDNILLLSKNAEMLKKDQLGIRLVVTERNKAALAIKI